MEKAGLRNPFYGLQIRKTDFGAGGADDDALFELVRMARDKRFFVCSDDKGVEALSRVRIGSRRREKGAVVFPGVTVAAA